jgi:hypothetical protein
MQLKQYTAAPRVDALPAPSEQRTTEHIQIAVSSLELRISELSEASDTALLAQLQHLTASNVPTNRQQTISIDATIAIEGGKAA